MPARPRSAKKCSGIQPSPQTAAPTSRTSSGFSLIISAAHPGAAIGAEHLPMEETGRGRNEKENRRASFFRTAETPRRNVTFLGDHLGAHVFGRDHRRIHRTGR